MSGIEGVGSVTRSLSGPEGGPRGIRLGSEGGKSTSFADLLDNALGEVSDLETRAQDAIGLFLRGEPVEIHEVMAASEEAGIALEMLVEIRNKLTEAYRTVMQMQQ